MKLTLSSPFKPTGDQPQAIEALSSGIENGEDHQVLLGVTGSGKTYTVANVIEKVQKPTLIIAHNKTLAAQLYQEFRDFFPNNAVSYFVSYYDYYQPEAYIPTTDTYIEKEATINDEIDKVRLATTTNLLTRPDVIVVASVSAIYNLGSPQEYGNCVLELIEGEVISRETLLLTLASMQYDRTDTDFRRGTYRIRGESIFVWPAYEDRALRINTFSNRIDTIEWVDPISGVVVTSSNEAYSGQNTTVGKRKYQVYPAKHYIMDPAKQGDALKQIEKDLHQRLKELNEQGKKIEAYRLQQKVQYDLEMLREFGFVNGIENYSIYFDGRHTGDAPDTLLAHFQANAARFGDGSFLTVIDESHITLPQIRGMHAGDRSRKQTLIDYGFRLPTALDNRPLNFSEFLDKTDQLIHVSATPGDVELKLAQQTVVEQLVRPTGLVEPLIELKHVDGQIEDLIKEIIIRKQKGQRTLVTTLTKKMAEALTEYLNDSEKIQQLLHRSAQQPTVEDPDKTIWSETLLPIEDMSLGKIDEQYYNHLTLSSRVPSDWRGRDQLKHLAKKTSSESVDLVSENLLPKVAYLHSDVDTLERIDILDDLRRGVYDVVVGINLLREGLDLPEVTLVAILDADKAGFLRSTTSLIQTMGRAARHDEGHVILYADVMTAAMKSAITEVQRRRIYQTNFNLKHNITPQRIEKKIRDTLVERVKEEDKESKKNKKKNVVSLSKTEQIDLNQINSDALTPHDKKKLVTKLQRKMKQAANEMDFELAAELRDIIATLQ